MAFVEINNYKVEENELKVKPGIVLKYHQKKQVIENFQDEFLPMNDEIACPLNLKYKWDMLKNIYDNQQKSKWTESEIPIDDEDIEGFKELEPEIQTLILGFMTYFLVADKIIISNMNWAKKIPYRIAKNFYALQTEIENIHDISYVKTCELYFKMLSKDSENKNLNNLLKFLQQIIDITKNDKNLIFDINNYESGYYNSLNLEEKKIITAVINLMNGMNQSTINDTLTHSIIDYFLNETLCFVILFDIIGLSKITTKNIKGLKYLTLVNDFVEIDEDYHASFGKTLYKEFCNSKIPNDMMKEKIKVVGDSILGFLKDLLPEYCFGIKKEDFYIRYYYLANNLYQEVTQSQDPEDQVYQTKTEFNPVFDIRIKSEKKINFFERTGVYITDNEVINSIKDLKFE